MAEHEERVQIGEEVELDTFRVLSELDIANDGLVEWITPWTRNPNIEDPRRVDWVRYGYRVEAQSPGFSSVIIYDGVSSGTQTWRNLVDEAQLDQIIAELDTEDLRPKPLKD